MDKIKQYIQELGQQTKKASRSLRIVSTAAKNAALLAIAKAIQDKKEDILKANKKDLINGEKNGLDAALLDRLMLNDERIKGIITSLNEIVALKDPVGDISNLSYRPSGIQVGKMRVPLGVIGIIYESRPNVTIDAAALCLKSGNAAILRGGSEAFNSNIAFYECIKIGLKNANLDINCISFIETTDRNAVVELVKLQGIVDAIIPRGGRGLIENISKYAKVPVIKHLDGICHTYIDKDANKDMAIKISFNAKTRRYGVCNAMETLLVHKSVASDVLIKLSKMYQNKGVELRGCEKTLKVIKTATLATEKDWHTEYLAAILAIKIVNDMDEAISHIDKYGSGHTDAIITENYTTAREFLTKVDSSSVMVNASTGFADGFEYGLGAEIGISTDKFHVRGPVGLEGLTSQKFIVLGSGNIRP